MAFAARKVPLALPLAAMWLAAACLPGTGPALLPDEAGAASIDLGGDAGPLRVDANLGDPFGIDGLTPSHGPFNGGTRAQVDGRGFTTKLRVFVGGVEVDTSGLLASDSTRAAIVTPPGPPGFVDVRIRDELTGTERTLKNGFYYDAFYVVPSSGATSGGTRIAISGSGTGWSSGTRVAIDGVDCADVVVKSKTQIECVTPVGTPGSKDVVVTPPDGPAIQARDAFTYSDSVDGYRGGLSGGALAGRVKVLAFDSILGLPIPGAFAVVGESLATAKIARTSSNGVVEIPDVPGDKATVTVAAKCFSPTTFVDVPVDTVTVYLDPLFDPACATGTGSPPSGQPRFGGFVEGDIVFPGGGEFERNDWSTVPPPTRPTERRAAYVFEAAQDPTQPFVLPPASEAITPDTDGTNGYKYSVLVFPGNSTVYAVAGLEDRSQTPPTFVPYSMGVARGVAVPSQGRTAGVDLEMSVLFDHEVIVAASPPPPGPRGPDRFTAQVAITLGAAGYALLPMGTRTTPLPAPDQIPFVGVPSLDHALSGESYVLGGVAATGATQKLPASLVTRVNTTNANTPVSLGGFLAVPVLDQPGYGIWNGTHVSFGAAGGAADLTVIHVVSGSGLVDWTIAAPGGRTSFDLPDLAALTTDSPDKPGPGMLHGQISTTVYRARIEHFDYGTLRYGQLSTSPWAAYAFDSLNGVY